MIPKLKVFDGETPSRGPANALLPLDLVGDPDLTQRGAILIWALANWAWGKRPDCFPSNGAIARHTKRSTRWVQLALADAIAAGYVERRMVPTDAGWRRVLFLNFRSPSLRLVSDAPGAGIRATPRKPIHTPRASSAPKCENGKEKNLNRRVRTAAALKGRHRPRRKNGHPTWDRPDTLTFSRVQISQCSRPW